MVRFPSSYLTNVGIEGCGIEIYILTLLADTQWVEYLIISTRLSSTLPSGGSRRPKHFSE
jgi:hypothetical protein